MTDQAPRLGKRPIALRLPPDNSLEVTPDGVPQLDRQASMERCMRIIVLFFLALALPVTSSAAESASAGPEIQLVIDQFRESIVEKDKDKFLATFLHNSVTWQAATSDEKHALEIKSDPEARKVAYDPGDTPEAFIDGIVRSQARIEETFSGVEIDSDGTVASVAFDFEFLVNGKATNVGREYWLLVKTTTGWKIAAVTWSRNTPSKLSGSMPTSSLEPTRPRGEA